MHNAMSGMIIMINQASTCMSHIGGSKINAALGCIMCREHPVCCATRKIENKFKATIIRVTSDIKKCLAC